jgi:hypothetical protein
MGIFSDVEFHKSTLFENYFLVLDECNINYHFAMKTIISFAYAM